MGVNVKQRKMVGKVVNFFLKTKLNSSIVSSPFSQTTVCPRISHVVRVAENIHKTGFCPQMKHCFSRTFKKKKKKKITENQKPKKF